MNIPQNILNLINLFKQNNFKLYIIGGAVRDYLLNRKIKEYDLTTDATVEEMICFLKDYKLNIYQSNLGAIKLNLNNELIEITTMRKEIGVKDLRYPEEIIFVETLKEDVLRRDFTINQIAYHPEEGIIDYLNGIEDLNNQLVRFIGDPIKRIKEDPVRILRALRFSFKLNFEIEENTLSAINMYAYLVKDLKQIRFMEFYQIFKEEKALDFIKKHYQIYINAFPELNVTQLDLLLNCNYDYHLNEIYFFTLFEQEFSYKLMNDLGINNHLQKLIKMFLEYQIDDGSLLNTKYKMIEYQNNLNLILELLKIDNLEYVKKTLLMIEEIKNNQMCLKKEDLDLTYNELKALEIPNNKWNECFHYLLEKVLANDQLNKKDLLINLIKEKYNI